MASFWIKVLVKHDSILFCNCIILIYNLLWLLVSVWPAYNSNNNNHHQHHHYCPAFLIFSVCPYLSDKFKLGTVNHASAIFPTNRSLINAANSTSFFPVIPYFLSSWDYYCCLFSFIGWYSREHIVKETRSVSILSWGVWDSYSVCCFR
jgi:hypothetical protein